MLFHCSTSELHPVDHVSLGEQLSGTNDVEMVVKLAADTEPGSSGEYRLFHTTGRSRRKTFAMARSGSIYDSNNSRQSSA